MDINIYLLHQPNQPIILEKSNITYDKYPVPKLIKYGFTDITDKIDIVSLTIVPQYVAGLELNFSNIEKKSLGIFSDINIFDNTFTELWEILLLFNLLNSDQDIYISDTYHQSMNNIIDFYQKISKQKNKYNINNKLNKQATLVINKISDIEIDENAYLHIILNDLHNLLKIQNKGSNMILQLFCFESSIMIELIYFLSSLYNETYIIKPMSTSYFTDIKYLVLIGYKENNNNLSILKHDDKTYISSLGLKNIPDILKKTIQCINSTTKPKKNLIYSKIKQFIDSKIYVGSNYDEMLYHQNSNLITWVKTFSDLKNISELLDKLIKKSVDECNIFTNLVVFDHLFQFSV